VNTDTDADTQVVPRADGVICRLIYRSRDLMPPERHRAELGELFTAARAHNKAMGITGALLLRGDVFVQTLEGDEDTVHALLGRIRSDVRHDRLEVLETDLVQERVFARWAMARVGDADDAPDTNLIAHVEGIAPAAPRGGATVAQESVLEVMRSAARGRQPV
jgi:Sensors of blue-light using FAD